MAFRTILFAGLRILAVCFLFAVCFAIGGALSGIDKIAQRPVASQPAPPATQQVPQTPENFLPGFLIFTFCVPCCPAEPSFAHAAACHPRRGLRLPVHVLRLLCRLEKPRPSAFLCKPGT